MLVATMQMIFLENPDQSVDGVRVNSKVMLYNSLLVYSLILSSSERQIAYLLCLLLCQRSVCSGRNGLFSAALLASSSAFSFPVILEGPGT